MALTEIRVYDYIGNKKTVVIPLKEMKTVRVVCRHLHPRYEEEKYTLYFDEEPLSWDSTFEYLEKKYSLNSSKVLTFKFRFCTFQEAMKRLQREDYQLKNLITSGELKAYSKGGQMIFKEADIDNLIHEQMEEPTLILTPDKLQDLGKEEEEAEEEESESLEEENLEESFSLQLGSTDDEAPTTTDSSLNLPEIDLGSQEEIKEEEKPTASQKPSIKIMFEDVDDEEEKASADIGNETSEGFIEMEDSGEIELPSPDELSDEQPATEESSLEEKMKKESATGEPDWANMETVNESQGVMLEQEVDDELESAEQRQETINDLDVVPSATMSLENSPASPPPPPPAPAPGSSNKEVSSSPANAIPLERGGKGTLSPTAATQIEEVDSPAEIKRHSRITYYNQMNPLQHYLLKVDVSKQKMKVVTKGDISQATGSVHIPKSIPQVEIVPSFPGCLIMPERIHLDISPSETVAEFWLTPLTEGDLGVARVDFYHQGKKLSSISTPTKIVKTTWAKASLVAGFIAPILSAIFSAFEIDVKENLPPLFQLLSSFVGPDGFVSLANFGLIFFLFAVVFGLFLYTIKKPRQADPIECTL